MAIVTGIGPGSVAARAQAPKTVGIRLIDAPSNRSDDPRALQYIVDHLPPGTTIERRIGVDNDTDDVQVVELYAAAGAITDGTFQFGAGRAVNELTTWTAVDPAEVTVPPGATAEATVTIAVPAKASPGERYGVVWAQLAASTPEGGGITAVNRVGVRIYLSVGEGGEPASDFDITAFEARRDAEGNPVVAATVHNTGGRALDLSGDLSLTNGPGGLSAGPFAATLGTTLGIGQTEPVLVTLDRAITAGPWDARIALHSGIDERVATATLTFPAAAASSSGPVATDTGGSSVLPVVGGIVLVALVVLVVSLLLRRTKGDRARV
ncbi:MAG: hypothetical protein QOG43_835 [Actinomycetota bacterium]|jgi:hypothetical protein|nr:hypothetical protein [Actinomycetota bacterium]